MAGDTESTTLGDYFTLQRGTTYKSKLLGQPGPLLLGLATIQRNGGFRTNSLQTYGGDSPEKLLVRPGELYLSLKDVTQSADLLGAVARLPADHSPGRLTQDTVRLVPKRKDAPLSYLYWLLRTPQYRNYCRAHATGTTNLGLAREDFLAFPVPELTPIRDRIVNILGTLDDKIELNRRMNETLEAIARAIFKSWFVDFDPVRAKAEGRQPAMMDVETAALFPSEFEEIEGREVPKGWRVVILSELSSLDKGVSYKGDFLSEEGISMINLGCFTGEGKFSINNLKFYGGEYRERHVVKSGDIVLANTDITQKREVLGSPAIVPPFSQFNRCIFTHHVYAIRFKKEFETLNYVVYFSLLNPDFRDRAIGFATGTTVLALPRDTILEYSLIIPDPNIIQQFNNTIKPVFSLIYSNIDQSRTLARIRDSLLPKLISGEIRIAV